MNRSFHFRCIIRAVQMFRSQLLVILCFRFHKSRKIFDRNCTFTKIVNNFDL